MYLSELFIYPVKSLRGLAVKSALIDSLGFVGDRRFLVVDENGRQLTQRPLPRMTLIETQLTREDLILSTSNSSAVSVPLRSRGNEPQRAVSVWKSEGLLADDCGDEVANWLTSFLGVTCRLVRIGKQYQRPILDEKRARSGDNVSFADGYPFLVISEASLADLNMRMHAAGEPTVPMNRFRPSLVVAGCSAFAEDEWSQLIIGNVQFRAGGPCSRCVITTTDQQTGARGPEPLRTLASFRRDPAEPSSLNFGQNLIHETKSGELHTGDVITVL